MSKNKHKFPTQMKVSASYKVDVVILVYGGYEHLTRCLASLPAAFGETPYGVWLVENGNPKPEVSKAFFANLNLAQNHIAKVYRLGQNVGFPRGCNFGAREGRAPYLLFLNDDVEMQPGSIKLLVEQMEAHKDYGVIGPLLLFPENSTEANRPAGRVQHAGLEVNVRAEVFHIYSGWSRENPRVQQMAEPAGVTGACLLTRRSLFKRAGTFFEGYGKGTYEDIDLSLTIKSFGCKIIYEPKSVGYHYVGSSAIQNNDPFPLARNQELFKIRQAAHLTWTECNRL